ncbi:hypothetical protein [Sphingomonas sp.]|uniref:hypothetical protein n=1 Tax=Sphingomonas sp. TaxID=28214 RepID=UPI001D2BA71D|nr:hypothetical protein [Sphingomonas sp.]MBX9796144.1 hypothetical protein [Sphingomonas sp.]
MNDGQGQRVRIGLTVIGALGTAMGLLWVAQGLGWVHWPPESFMLDQRPWAVRGAALALAGIGAIIWARR